jgi:hypothetical protein
MEAASLSPWRPIGRFLVERGLITEDELEKALAEQRESGLRLGEILVGKGWVSGPELAAIVSAIWRKTACGMPVIRSTISGV